jgi:hypothetical protein
MLYEILYPQKDYIGAKDMDRAVLLYLKKQKDVSRVIITDHVEEAEYNIIKVKNKHVIKKTSRTPKGFNLSMQTPVFFSGNTGTSQAGPVGPPIIIPQMVPSSPSNIIPTPPIIPKPSIPTQIPSVPVINSPIIKQILPKSIDTPIIIPNIQRSPPSYNPTPKPIPAPIINQKLPQSIDPIVLPQNIPLTPAKNITTNKKIYDLDICVLFGTQVWRVINISKSSKTRSRYISIQSMNDPNKKAIITYNKTDLITGAIVKRIIRKCIKLLTPSSTTEPETKPFNIDELDPEVIDTFPSEELIKPAANNDEVEVWDDNENNIDYFNELKVNHRTRLYELKIRSENEINLYLRILDVLEKFYACIYINKTQKDTELAKNITNDINYIINTEFFIKMLREAVPPEILLRPGIGMKDIKQMLMITIKDSAIDKIKKDTFVNYEECKSIANIEAIVTQIKSLMN